MASETLTNTNISNTYVGVLHAKGEALPTSPDLQYVYDGFGNRSALKIGRAGIDVDGDVGVNFINTIYPVGSVIFSADNVNPGTRFTGTTWTQISQGRFIAGVGTGTDINTDTHTIDAGEDSTTGEYTHQLTIDEMPAHSHDITLESTDERGYDYQARFARSKSNLANFPAATDSTGNSSSHNNIPPYYGLYVWSRTA